VHRKSEKKDLEFEHEVATSRKCCNRYNLKYSHLDISDKDQ